MYAPLLTVHLAFSWVCIALLIGLFGLRRWRSSWSMVRPIRALLNASLAVQLCASLLLHLRYSAYTSGVRANVGVVLHDPTLRYWNLLHPALGTLAILLSWWVINRQRAPGSPPPGGKALAAAIVITAAAMASTYIFAFCLLPFAFQESSILARELLRSCA